MKIVNFFELILFSYLYKLFLCIGIRWFIILIHTWPSLVKTPCGKKISSQYEIIKKHKKNSVYFFRNTLLFILLIFLNLMILVIMIYLKNI